MNRFKSKRRQAELSRSNLSSSIRGKISAPIPIEDDEFPIRFPGANLATPVHEDPDKQLQLPSAPTPELGTTADATSTELPRLLRTVQAPASQEPEAPSRQSGSVMSRFKEMDLSTTPDANGTKPKRTKSTLRSVLGRWFGGKKGIVGESPGPYSQASRSPRAGQHLSDLVTRTPPDRPSPHERARSAPINAFNRPLRSHSVNGTSPSQIHNNDNDDAEVEQKARQRSSTTTSRLDTTTKFFEFPTWNGLTPRPLSGMVGEGEVEESRIGYAVTSGSHLHRRSRSLDHLRTTIALQGPVRRRSEDIKFWRESYDPDALSPMSSQNLPEGERYTVMEELSTHLDKETNELYKPPQPFNFGPTGEMAGMKITQAASLESRVSKLEERLERIGSTVSQIQRRTSRSRIPVPSPSIRRSVPDGNWPSPRLITESAGFSLPRNSTTPYQHQHNQPADAAFSSQGNLSVSNSRPSIETTHQSNGHSYDELSQPSTNLSSPDRRRPELLDSSSLSVQPSDRQSPPLSASTTLRGPLSTSPMNSSMPMSQNGSLTAHHYSALLNLIQAEQAAREKLEVQVRELQHQLNAIVSRAPYPTPSPEYGGKTTPRKLSHSARRDQLSVFEHESSDIDSDDEGDYGRYEEYGTPDEESDVFVPNSRLEAEAGEVEERKTPRTLSLSRMTLGQGIGYAQG